MTIKRLIAAALISTASFTGASLALAANDAKAAYKAAEDAADATYKSDLAKCDSLSGNGKDVCVAQAKATREHTTQDAKAAYKKTPKALASARKEGAEADYAVAREKCNGLAGNAKDVCVKQAKADEANALTDANAKQEISQTTAAVRDERAEERYKVALAKCDGQAGPTKEACVTAAEGERGK